MIFDDTLGERESKPRQRKRGVEIHRAPEPLERFRVTPVAIRCLALEIRAQGGQ